MGHVPGVYGPRDLVTSISILQSLQSERLSVLVLRAKDACQGRALEGLKSQDPTPDPRPVRPGTTPWEPVLGVPPVPVATLPAPGIARA